MSFATLLTARVTVRRGETVTADGVVVEDSPGTLVADAVPARITQATDRTALRDNAGRIIADYRGFLGVDAPALEVGDRLVAADGTVYRVAGAPIVLEGARGPHHVEVALRREEL